MTSSETIQDSVESEKGSGRKRARLENLLLALSVFGLAVVVRAIPWQYVLSPNGVVFRDGDGYAHMWRIWNAASKGTPLSARDPFVNYPHGGEVVWPPAFDWILATLVRWLGLDQPGAELFCAWVPPVLGGFAVVLAALVASYTFSRSAGWLTGIMLALLPGSFLYTQLGYLDHHAAITLIGTAMLGGSMYVVSVGGAGPRLWPVLAGGLGALALSIWVGALLHIGILQIALLVWALGAASQEEAVARTLRLSAAHALVGLAILPLSLRDWEIFGDFNPLVLTRFQPTWFVAGAMTLGAAVMLWRFRALGGTRRGRLVSAAAIAIVGLGLAFASIPELLGILDRSAGWFTGDVEFMSEITELEPLFDRGDAGIWWRPMLYLSALFFLLPVAMIAVGRLSPRPETGLLLFWTAAFLALTINQFRFVNTFSVAQSIVLAGALSEGFVRFEASARSRRSVRTVVGILLATILLVPAWTFYSPRLRDGGSAITNVMREARFEIARYLAMARPPTLDVNGQSTSGLLGIWDTGHEFRYYSGWAVHQDGFGPFVSPENTRMASRYYESLDEDAAVEILEALRTRYVVADIHGAGQPPYSIRSMTSRLVQLRGSGGEMVLKDSRQRPWLPALSRHRLVFAAANGRGGVWLYEIVPGAVVVGSATPGSRVSIDLELDSPFGNPVLWTTRQQVDESGSFRLRVPYATVDRPESGFDPAGPYQLHTRDGVTEFDVSEAAIQAGSTIMIPFEHGIDRDRDIQPPSPPAR